MHYPLFGGKLPLLCSGLHWPHMDPFSDLVFVAPEFIQERKGALRLRFVIISAGAVHRREAPLPYFRDISAMDDIPSGVLVFRGAPYCAAHHLDGGLLDSLLTWMLGIWAGFELAISSIIFPYSS